MPRPPTVLLTINNQAGAWDQTVSDNNDTLRNLLFLKPYPMPLVHRSAANEGSVALSTYAAADYKWCYAHVVDPATVATNGYLIFSDGTNWRYHKSNNTV